MSATLLRIIDESATGDFISEISVSFDSPNITVQDIIAARVTEEVERYNRKASVYFHGLVTPTAAEATLNGFRMKKRHMVDAEQQVYIALDAFQRNGFFVFIDDLQAESLDEQVQLTDSTKVSFLKLTPLVGG